MFTVSNPDLTAAVSMWHQLMREIKDYAQMCKDDLAKGDARRVLKYPLHVRAVNNRLQFFVGKSISDADLIAAARAAGYSDAADDAAALAEFVTLKTDLTTLSSAIKNNSDKFTRTFTGFDESQNPVEATVVKAATKTAANGMLDDILAHFD